MNLVKNIFILTTMMIVLMPLSYGLSQELYIECTFVIPGSYCGDSTCGISEDCSSCPIDCGVCPSGGGGGSYSPTPIYNFNLSKLDESVTLYPIGTYRNSFNIVSDEEEDIQVRVGITSSTSDKYDGRVYINGDDAEVEKVATLSGVGDSVKVDYRIDNYFIDGVINESEHLVEFYVTSGATTKHYRLKIHLVPEPDNVIADILYYPIYIPDSSIDDCLGNMCIDDIDAQNGIRGYHILVIILIIAMYFLTRFIIGKGKRRRKSTKRF